MTDQKTDKQEIHYCNTCKHIQKPVSEEPCKSCAPENFGGPDRWEAKYEHK